MPAALPHPAYSAHAISPLPLAPPPPTSPCRRHGLTRGRVIGATAACCATAAGVWACLLVLLSASLAAPSADSPKATAVRSAQDIMTLLLSLPLMCAVLVIGPTISLWTGQWLQKFAVLRTLGMTAGRLRRAVTVDVARLALVPVTTDHSTQDDEPDREPAEVVALTRKRSSQRAPWRSRPPPQRSADVQASTRPGSPP
ncbi:hypothetical protein GKJPGBOP_03420 [Streptomyces paromomycinus]|uniref:Uncharacterized protein n=1 Tax=Streptomyces paromomycinus TaxID=92743 RepID=A0A401W322_STREY|nr:hypothetical protein GKJPGBOP_03420 [Streptomyces paromomycinus]